MAVATQLGMCASPFLCPSPVAAKPAATPLACASSTVVVCRQGDTEHHAIVTSRRSFAVAAGVASTLGVFSKPPSADAKRTKPPPPPEPKAEAEDKALSAYDARLLANARRREAMKVNIDKLKAKASKGASVGSVVTGESAETAGPDGPAETAS